MYAGEMWGVHEFELHTIIASRMKNPSGQAEVRRCTSRFADIRPSKTHVRISSEWEDQVHANRFFVVLLNELKNPR